jgi:hypothetical protein
MKPKTLKLLVLSSLIVFSIWMTILKGEASSTPGDQALVSTGLGSSDTLQASYDAWAAHFEKSGGERNIVLPMNACQGISTEKEGVYGLATLNLIDGRVSVEVRGLPGAEGLDLWLIDNKPGVGRTILPEPGDAMVEVGSLTMEGDVAKLDAGFGDGEPEAFEPDLVVITHAGKSPIQDRLLTAQTTLFHRLYRSAKRGQFGVLRDSVEPEQPEGPKGLLKRIADLLLPSAHAQIGPNPNPTTALDQLIVQGRNTFFNSTFNGNGRTCGTCHREENNLTIDPKFIATLPPNDPLFVAEFNPALSQNFENPMLLRKFGLILLNVDGFDDLNNKFVMRGVLHTLAMLPGTLKPGELDETHPIGQPPVPPVERLGWSGDGAPVGTFTLADGRVHQATGTLRDFMIGAIIQHYPKTLNRVPGVDFRMPTVAELDSLEAFQKSLGRRENLKLAGALRLKSGKS